MMTIYIYAVNNEEDIFGQFKTIMAIEIALAVVLHGTQQNTFRHAFCRYKSFAAVGAVPELRDEPVTVRQGTVVRRPDHRQHVPVERGRVRPSVGDRRGSGERHDLRTTEVIRY